MRNQPDNLFSPPNASLTEARDNTPGSAMKAIAVGLVVDIGGTFLLDVLVGIGYAIYLATTNTPWEEVAASAEMVDFSSPLWITTTLLGTFLSGLGGYVCARIAKRDEYRITAVMATLSVLIALLMAGSYYAPPVLGILAAIAFTASMLGARLGRARNRQP